MVGVVAVVFEEFLLREGDWAVLVCMRREVGLRLAGWYEAVYLAANGV